MSLSVDDLVASFGTSHIGQEQMDLQAFKLQMAKQLNQQGSHRPSQGVPVPMRRNSLAQPHANSPAQTGMASEDDREDEMMVEDMLVAPASPTVAAAPAAPWATQQQYQPQSSWMGAPAPAYTHVPTPQPPPFAAPQQYRAQEQPSLFATTDPFYLSLTQHTQQAYFSRPHHGSVFQMDGGAVLVDR
ncbi:hypothetical protein PENSPDRAFT_756280 [Peniophora sp. CONT]|nr:hypothetical protein PENSPDRAFT_756280 [Peniophora sp. CONT]